LNIHSSSLSLSLDLSEFACPRDPGPYLAPFSVKLDHLAPAMAFNFVLPVRIVQAVFAIIVIGVLAYGKDVQLLAI